MPRVGQPAPLTPTQRMLISTVLAELAPTRTDLARRTASALAVSNCDCGCPSVDVLDDAPDDMVDNAGLGTQEPTTAMSRSAKDNVDLISYSPDRQLMAIVSVRAGRVSSLDCISQGEAASFPPELETMHGWTFIAAPSP